MAEDIEGVARGDGMGIKKLLSGTSKKSVVEVAGTEGVMLGSESSPESSPEPTSLHCTANTHTR